MKNNPLFLYLNRTRPSISHRIKFPEGGGAKRNYLLIEREEKNDVEIFPTYNLLHKHLRIDKVTSIMAEVEHSNRYSSNLCPAHYTERYHNPDNDDQLVLHIYYNLQGRIVRIHAKNETKNEPLALSEEQITIATSLSNWGSEILKEISASRNDHVKKQAEQAKIKQRITEFYGTLPNINPQQHSRLLVSIIPTMEWNDLFTHGEITPQTHFIRKIAKLTLTPAKQERNTKGFRLLDSDASGESKDDDPNTTKDTTKEASAHPSKKQAPRSSKQPNVLDEQLQKLEELIGRIKSEQDDISVYHEYYRSLVGHFYSLEYEPDKLTAQQATLIQKTKETLAEYVPPYSQMLDFSKTGQIDKLDIIIGQLEISPEIATITILAHVAGKNLNDITDKNLSQLIQYLLTCDKFTNPEDSFSECYVRLKKNDPPISFKQQLFFKQYYQSFLKLTELLPDKLLANPFLSHDTIELLAAFGNYKLTLQYLDRKGATHLFGQNQTCTRYYAVDVRDKGSIDKIGHAKKSNQKFRKFLKNLPQEKKDSRKPNRTVLLKEMYKHGKLNALVESTEFGSPEFNARVKLFRQKYQAVTGPLHSLLHAMHSLLRSESIITRKFILPIPSFGYHLCEKESTDHVESFKYGLEQVGLTSGMLPISFISFDWFPTSDSIEEKVLIDVCYEIISDLENCNVAESLLKVMSDELTKTELMMYYGEDVVIEAFFIANIILLNQHLNMSDSMSKIITHKSILEALSMPDSVYQKNDKRLEELSVEKIKELHELVEKLSDISKSNYLFSLKSSSKNSSSKQSSVKESLVRMERSCALYCKKNSTLNKNLKRLIIIQKRLSQALKEHKRNASSKQETARSSAGLKL